MFGSYAYGTPKEESDLDLCVLMETKGEDPFQIARCIADSIDPPIVMWMGRPLCVWVQIHVFSPSEFEASLSRLSGKPTKRRRSDNDRRAGANGREDEVRVVLK